MNSSDKAKLQFKANDVPVQRTGERAICHVKVAEVAKAAAGELYESLMGNNELFRAWTKQNPGAGPKELERRFIEKNWPRCIEFARTTLTVLLTQPDVSDATKDEIMDVLEKDQSLRNKNIVPHPRLGRPN